MAYLRLAEIDGEYLDKGSKVYVEGRLQTRKWQGQDGVERYTTEVVINDLQMLDSRGGAGGGGGFQGQSQGGGSSYNQGGQQAQGQGGFGGQQQQRPAQQPAQQQQSQQNQQNNNDPFIPDNDFDDDIPF